MQNQHFKTDDREEKDSREQNRSPREHRERKKHREKKANAGIDEDEEIRLAIELSK